MSFQPVEISGRERVERALREAQAKSKKHLEPIGVEDGGQVKCEPTCEKCGE